jgi:hypothetical protein
MFRHHCNVSIYEKQVIRMVISAVEIASGQGVVLLKNFQRVILSGMQ